MKGTSEDLEYSDVAKRFLKLLLLRFLTVEGHGFYDRNWRQVIEWQRIRIGQ